MKIIPGSLLIFSCLWLGSCQSLTDNFPSEENMGSQAATSLVADATRSSALEQDVYRQINQYRQSRHLAPLTFNNTIAQQARIHSQRMAAKTVPFSHEGFEKRLQQIGQTIPYQQAAENVAFNEGAKDPATVAVQGWLKSPGHLKNIESNFNLTGVGVALNRQGEYYFTQIFIKPQAASGSSDSKIKKASLKTNVLTALEQKTYQQVNQYRRSQKLSPLLWDNRISEVARRYSQKMANGEATFSHNGFEGRVKAIANQIPTRTVGENLAFNMGYSDPVKVAVEGWIKSPGHRKNMQGNFDLTGIGIAKNAKGEYYLTQLFVKRR
ncbi:CAP domain-containing protein [Gloeothece verrucosa]|uniref:SCP-like extracellular n=1 Tax=Gloeothece verrucosa (strain PCC 7822) TaxID=497965 RepID=E0UHM9_GLOV7|nr:CAP domain-containing protein [Gloeothece verrucosa]ADN13286.1 SCP-like extracellular [Gloeothece verrucosa PCC 7822]